MSQLYDAVNADGTDDTDMDASARVPGAGAWKFDNMKPQDNWWVIISSSDEGDGIVNPQHRTTVKVKRYNLWRDETETARMRTSRQIEVKAQADGGNLDAARAAAEAQLAYLKNAMDAAEAAKVMANPATYVAYQQAKDAYMVAFEAYNAQYGTAVP